MSKYCGLIVRCSSGKTLEETPRNVDWKEQKKLSFHGIELLSLYIENWLGARWKVATKSFYASEVNIGFPQKSADSRSVTIFGSHLSRVYEDISSFVSDVQLSLVEKRQDAEV